MMYLITSSIIALYVSVVHVSCGYGESLLVRWVEQGHDVILYCNLAGTEESFDWTRGPNYTASTHNLLAYNNRGVIRGECLTQAKCELLGRNLKLKNARIADEDTYYCGTPKTYTSVILKVTIEPLTPTINNCNKNKTCAIIFPAGFSLHLTCIIRGSRPAAELTWSKNAYKVNNGTKTFVYENQDGTFDTVIFLQVKHNGPSVYKCEAQGASIRQSWKASTTINVTEAIYPDSSETISKYPEIDYCGTQTNCSLTWPVGFPLQLQCTVRGYRTSVKLSWWHNEKDLSKNTTNEIHWDKNGVVTSVSAVTLHISESTTYYCVAASGDSNLDESQKTSTIHISSTEYFSLELKSEQLHTDSWKISTIVCLSLIFLTFGLLLLYGFRKRKQCFKRALDTNVKGRKKECLEDFESKVAQESQDNDKEGDTLLTQAHDEIDFGRNTECSEKPSNVYQPSDNNISLTSNGESSQHGASSSPLVTTERKDTETRVSAPPTYSGKKEKLSDSEETTTDNSSSTTSEHGAVSPWSEGAAVETGEFHEKLSSPQHKGRLITANHIRSKRRSFNFSLEDQESDILLAFSMKGYGLIISFVPYLGPCDEGYIIHFQEQGDITFSKHGMKIDFSNDKNHYDPSKKLNFIINTASKKILLMEEDANYNKPLLRYTPIQIALCTYLVISAHENSQFDMVLFPVKNKIKHN